MQDRYTGDIGDFGKYGLLKALCGDDLSLGVAWYLFPDEEQNADGSHIRHLEPTPTNLRKLRACDPALYDALGGIVRDRARSIRSVQERVVLPHGTAFYEAPLSFREIPWLGPKTRERRLAHRQAWLENALEATRGCDLVFADPDNGLEIERVRPYHTKGAKYAYFDELALFLKRGQSLVVYHHLHFGGPRETQVRERIAQVEERLGATFALLYRPGSGRAFFVIPAEAHRAALAERARRFVQDLCWSQHFALLGLEE